MFRSFSNQNLHEIVKFDSDIQPELQIMRLLITRNVVIASNWTIVLG